MIDSYFPSFLPVLAFALLEFQSRHRFESSTGTMKSVGIVAGLAVIIPAAIACGSGSSDSCYGPVNHVEHVRHVKRMQPGVLGASYGPTRPLEWGQLNVLHTVRVPEVRL